MQKQFFMLIFAVFAAALTAQTPALTFTPAHPKAGETLRFEYDLSQSPLGQGVEAIEVNALELAGETPEAREVMLRASGGKIVGQFDLSPGAKVALLTFKNGERIDNNNGEGHFIQLYDPTGKLLPQSLAAQAVLYRDWGSLIGLNRKSTVALDLLNRSFAANPALKNQYFSPYINNLLAVNRGDAGKTEALAFLDEVSKSGNLGEKDLTNLARLYERLGVADKPAAVREAIRKMHPKGAFVRQERRQAFRNEADLMKMESLIDAYQKDFPALSPEDQDEISDLYFMLGSKAAEKKDWVMVKKTAAKMNADNCASLYNNVAWELAENGEELEMARQMATEATEWAKNEMLLPKGAKTPYQTQHEWDEARRFTYAQYADTYAYILDKLNDPNSAVAYQAQSVEITKGDNTEMNERFTEYQERVKAPDLRYRLEGFIMQGKATAKMKDQFRRLFVSEDKSAAGTDAYIAGLEKIARANQKKEIAAKMLDQPAPDFQLKNLDGTEVHLAELKGKVVVIDFWATWCGPCKASFPGMQQTLTNMKDDPNVAFVFVDTWERAEDRVKVASEFIKSKGYPFNVLMDMEDKVVAAYGVTGIPTKFVVDRSGKIRFKSIGYSGSSEALVGELTAMIELAKEQP